MAFVDRFLIMRPELRACILAHEARRNFIPPKPAVPSDFYEPSKGHSIALGDDARYSAAFLTALIVDLTGFPAFKLKSSQRLVVLVRARHILCYLMRQHTGLSYPQIGRILGNRDHTTIMNAVAAVERAILTEELDISDDPHVMARRLWSSQWASR